LVQERWEWWLMQRCFTTQNPAVSWALPSIRLRVEVKFLHPRGYGIRYHRDGFSGRFCFSIFHDQS